MSHPYSNLPASHFWSRSVADVAPHELDPLVQPKFQVKPDDQIATIGSCFAQHLSRHLAFLGYRYLVTEKGPAGLSAEELRARNFGVFTARFGNVYTVRQAVQLVQRAFGRWQPGEEPWEMNGSWFDPFRPQVEPGGFVSKQDLELDRQLHLDAVRHMILEMNVLVFTLGLTEGWRAVSDGAILPVVPGASAGRFDSSEYAFINFSAAEVKSDLTEFIALIRYYNPTARILLTVSPVPLVATYSDLHVLSATTYSKSVLRVAAGEVTDSDPLVDYFPSYEVITGVPSGNRYFEDDLRSIREEGVSHVMRVFERHYIAGVESHTHAGFEAKAAVEITATSAVVCDEEILEP